MSDPADQVPVLSREGWPAFASQRAVWIPCPASFPAGTDQESWARQYAARWWAGSGQDYDDRQVAGLAKILSDVHDLTYRPGTCHVALIHMPPPPPVQQPLPVAVGVWQLQGAREARLRELVSAGDPTAIEPPVVEETSAEALGTGLRSLRYARFDDGTLYGAVNYAFRSEEYQTDLRFSASCPDLSRLQAAMPDIDELVRTTRLRRRGQPR
jgi:hypothetical protein